MALLSFPIECVLHDCLAAVVAECRVRTKEQKPFWYEFAQACHPLLLLHLKFFLLFAVKETKEEGITSYQHSNALLGARVCSQFCWRCMDKHTKTQHIHVTWPWMKSLYQVKEHTSEKRLICCWSPNSSCVIHSFCHTWKWMGRPLHQSGWWRHHYFGVLLLS